MRVKHHTNIRIYKYHNIDQTFDYILLFRRIIYFPTLVDETTYDIA